MKKVIVLSLLWCGFTQLNAQTGLMYNQLMMDGLSNPAMNNLNEKPSVQILTSTMDLLGGSQNQNVFNGRVQIKEMNYGVKASTLDNLGLEHRNVQVNAARMYPMNEHSELAFSVNLSYYSRQMERPNNQTETDPSLNTSLDYNNIYGGFGVAYRIKDFRVGLTSGDLFNTSLDNAASWNLTANYSVQILDSAIVLKPQVILNQGYDQDKTIAMFGVDAQLNKYVTTSMGYYTNEALHLGMGIVYNKLSLKYRYRYYYSDFRDIVGGQNMIEFSYQF